MKELYSGDMSAWADVDFDLNDPSEVPCTLIVKGLATDSINLQVSYDSGTTFVDVYLDGTQQVLNSTNNVVAIYAPGHYNLDGQGTTDTDVEVVLALFKNT